jgi:sarcosine oxidase/N-methyl-L-tryptophan oxidase
MYTLTADQNFVIDRHPLYPQIAFAAGLSGHGFKFTPALGQALVELAVDGESTLPIEFLNCRRPTLRETAS